MKKISYGRILLLAGMMMFLFVQATCKKDPPPDDPPEEPTYTCTSNITDGCMDDWKTMETVDGNYMEPMGGFLQTLNELSSLPPAAGGPGPVTCDTVTDCVQGKYAARVTSKNFHLMEGVDIFIPGYIGASVLDIPNATIHLGKPYTSKPTRFQAQYKYAPAGNDSAVIQVTLTRFNTLTSKRDTLSHDKIILHSAVSSYTQIDQALTYIDPGQTPDTLILIFAASAGIDFNDLQGCAGELGSVLWVDDAKFVLP